MCELVSARSVRIADGMRNELVRWRGAWLIPRQHGVLITGHERQVSPVHDRGESRTFVPRVRGDAMLWPWPSRAARILPPYRRITGKPDADLVRPSITVQVTRP